MTSPAVADGVHDRLPNHAVDVSGILLGKRQQVGITVKFKQGAREGIESIDEPG